MQMHPLGVWLLRAGLLLAFAALMYLLVIYVLVPMMVNGVGEPMNAAHAPS